MNRESLKEHCEKMCKIYEYAPSSNAYMEHRLVLDLLEQAEWIPVSERLPEENEVVLTQARFKDDIKMAVSARIDYNYWTGWGTREVNVVAWMPLPETYKVESSERSW